MTKARIGEPVRRKEDLRLITGAGQFADDLDAPRALRAVFVRSPHAHARLLAVDVEQARAMPGVKAVLTGADAQAAGIQSIPHATGSSIAGADVPLRNRDGSERLVSGHLPLVVDVARFVGEAVVAVIAETQDQARDAAEAVRLQWEPLPAVVSAIAARASDAAATDAAFEKAAHRVRLVTQVQRVTGVHMEPRTSLAVYDEKADVVTLHAMSGVGSVILRNELAASLGLRPEQTRVAAPPDVGGSFGTRNHTQPDFVVIAWAARLLKRPVKHVPERSEAFVSDFQARDLHVDIELAMNAKGDFLAVRSRNTSNIGAHTASFVALNKGVQLMTSVYRTPVAHVEARAVVTNTPCTIPYRSAGRPEAMYVVERLVDLAAQQCGFDRVALRKRNLIPKNKLPWRNPFGVTYDSGDYLAVMQRALDEADWTGFEKRRRAARKAGRLRGFGIANYIETTSGVPRERAEITVSPERRVDVIVGTQASGQGHETAFSQLVSDWLGVPFESVDVRYGDTAFVQGGGGSHSGRSMRLVSIVAHEASVAIIEKGKRIASHAMEADVGDIGFADGTFSVVGTDRTMDIFEVARVAQAKTTPQDLRGPLAATVDKVTPGLAFPFGAHACEIEIDADTGAMTIIKYVAIDDVGRAVNPMLLDGQTQGGIVQGLGQALMEQCYYDADGQLLAGTLMDYAMPRADGFPFFVTHLSEVPATSHPHGIRPGGEGGTTPSLAVMLNAIVDALKEFGVTHMDMPATPQRIWRAIHSRDSGVIKQSANDVAGRA